jgi:multidrug efflux pump
METQNMAHKDKEFSWSSWAVDNKVTVLVVTVLIALTGLMAYVAMPREAFPEVITPEIYVGTAYPGNAPNDMEKLITRPLEKEIKSISGVDEINSTSVQGYSNIDVKFNYNITPERGPAQGEGCRGQGHAATATSPPTCPSEPNVIELNFSELMPVMNINLSGDYSHGAAPCLRQAPGGRASRNCPA